VGCVLSPLLLDTHVLYWWSASSERVSPPAGRAIEQADELAVAAISWYELAWLARHERIHVTLPLRSWLGEIAAQVRTVPLTPAIADTATRLPASFPGDPTDRIIYATAVERGSMLVTKDRRLRDHPHPRQVTVW
jgi:PIN domain nuclease of toxin-antitoxin system